MQRRGGVPLAPRVHSKNVKSRQSGLIDARNALRLRQSAAHDSKWGIRKIAARQLRRSPGACVGPDTKIGGAGHYKIHALGPKAQFKSVAQCLNGRKMTSCVMAHACKRNAFARRGRQSLCWAEKTLMIGIKLA